jgi:hypothetical protein
MSNIQTETQRKETAAPFLDRAPEAGEMAGLRLRSARATLRWRAVVVD